VVARTAYDPTVRIGLALALVAAGATATPTATKQTLSIGDGNPEDRIAYERWATELRPCTPVDVTSAKRPLPDDLDPLVKRRQRVTVRGRVVPGVADCLLVKRTPPDCANGCSFDWILLPRPECPLWQFGIRRTDQSRLRGNGIDCDIRTFGPQAADVILTGHLEGDGKSIAPGDRYVMVTTDMCRVAGEAPHASQRLTDAEIAELTAPRLRAVPKCPPFPRRPAPAPTKAPAGPRSEADELNL
jgi:hypothetical protein